MIANLLHSLLLQFQFALLHLLRQRFLIPPLLLTLMIYLLPCAEVNALVLNILLLILFPMLDFPLAFTLLLAPCLLFYFYSLLF